MNIDELNIMMPIHIYENGELIETIRDLVNPLELATVKITNISKEEEKDPVVEFDLRITGYLGGKQAMILFRNLSLPLGDSLEISETSFEGEIQP